MRIAIVGSRGYPYVYNGYKTFVRELGERLVRRGHAVTVYCHRNLFPAPPSSKSVVAACFNTAISSTPFPS